jgi:outer membrane lipoprotein-sorting protein
VSELGDLLELLHGAAGRVDSVESRWRLWRHDDRVREAFIAHATRSGGRTVTVGSGEPDQRSPEHDEQVRFWWQRPDSIREERDAPSDEGSWTGHATLVIRVGATWWSFSPQAGAMTNAGDEHHSHGAGEQVLAMLDPSELTGLLDFTISGRGERAGRPVLLVRCQPRARDRRGPASFALHHLGAEAHEYAIEVDAERGVLLRAEARFDGQAISVTEALQIVFDTTLDPELFRFTPPAGEALRRSDAVGRFRDGIPIHEAVAAAPFTVHTLADPPADWELSATLHAGSARPLVHASVGLHYRSRDATAQLSISQTAAATAEDYSLPEGEDVERAGLSMRVRRRTDSWTQAQLSMTVDDTLITMNSDTLTADDLIRVATRLKPASAHPPQV